MLEIKNLRACVEKADGEVFAILQGLELKAKAGEVHAIMGPNGCGKSTLSHVLAGHPDYQIQSGTVELRGQDLLDLDPEDRAANGVFLSFQYPVEIPGVPILTFVREALNAQHRFRGEHEISAPNFMKLARKNATKLGISNGMLKRPVNVGFSGGEKKRMEIFQALMLQPKFLILDETDSGLDVDALKIVSDGVNALRRPDRIMLVITHYQRLLDYLQPDIVHVMSAGKVVASGGPDLANEIETCGYDKYTKLVS